MEIKSTHGLHSEQLKCLVYGQSGIGKTTLAGTLPEDQTLIISAESGLLCLGDKSIAVIECKTYRDVQSAFAWLMKQADEGKYKYIVIDSLTEISDLLVKDLKQSPEFADPKQTLKMWGEFAERMIKLIKAFRDLPSRNVIFTALAEDVNDAGTLIKKPMIAGNKAQQLLPSFFDEVFLLTIDPLSGERVLQTQPSSTAIAKDRSGKLSGNELPDLSAIFTKIRNQPSNVAPLKKTA